MIWEEYNINFYWKYSVEKLIETESERDKWSEINNMQWPMKLFHPSVRVIRWPNNSLHESLTHHFHILIRYSVVYLFVITFLVTKIEIRSTVPRATWLYTFTTFWSKKRANRFLLLSISHTDWAVLPSPFQRVLASPVKNMVKMCQQFFSPFSLSNCLLQSSEMVHPKMQCLRLH